MVPPAMTEHHPAPNLLRLTTTIVAAHLSRNALPAEELPALISGVHRALAEAGSDKAASARPKPAVPVNKSVMPDYIVCLEDGKRLKMLKRHLRSVYQMTPQEYRERWGLPADYPMVAPNYAKRRSALARDIGLGTRAGRGRRR